MKRFQTLRLIIPAIAGGLLGLAGCSTQPVASVALSDSKPRAPASAVVDPLNYATIFSMAEHKGKTFLSFMREKVKPALDAYAVNGYEVVDAATVSQSLNHVDSGVKRSAFRDAGSQQNLLTLAQTLNANKEKVTLYSLPNQIAATRMRVNRYGLSTFLGLVSGGGVAVRIDDRNIYYNVHYGTGQTEKDEMTGRSFGAAPLHKASDASDKFYLRELETLVRTPGEDIASFYRAVLNVLTNTDPGLLSRVSPLGQTVATDFLTIYTAEQDRHLMANFQSHAWDVALLEVTLLGAFHAGQDKTMVMYGQRLVDTTVKQGRQPPPAPPCTPLTVTQPASMIDWWQFSSNPDPAHCNRSGINLTKKDFRLLEQKISDYERRRHPGLVAKVEAHLGSVRRNGNIFKALTDFLIDLRAPVVLGSKGYQLADDFTEFLMQVKLDAKAITREILAAQPPAPAPAPSAQPSP